VSTVLYLFNLQPGVTPADYEHWAEAIDLPRLRHLPSVRDYRILRADPSPLATSPRYVEILDLTSPVQFRRDMTAPPLAAVAATFAHFAEAPTVLTCTELGTTSAHDRARTDTNGEQQL